MEAKLSHEISKARSGSQIPMKPVVLLCVWLMLLLLLASVQ